MAQDMKLLAAGSRFFVLTTTLNLAAGSAILTHLVDEVRVQGLGEGISLFIFVSMLLSECLKGCDSPCSLVNT